MNHKAIDAGATAFKKFDVPADWANAEDEADNTVWHRPRRSGGAGQDHPGSRGQDGRRQPARVRLRQARGRPVRAGRRRLREARRCRDRSHLGLHQVHPVQQLRLCLPPCHHPSLRSDRGGGQERPRRRQDRGRQGRQGQGRLQVHHGRQSPGLHGLRRVRGPVPRGRSDHGAPGAGGCPAGGLQLLRLRGLREEGHAGQHRQGQPVPAAHAGVLRLLRRLRRDQLCPPDHPAVRRSYVHLQRHRLLLHLGRSGCYLSLLHQQGRPWSRLVQLPVRGQRRARPGHVSGPAGHPQPSGGSRSGS